LHVVFQTTLSMITKGEFPCTFPDEMRKAFDSWYKDQVQNKTNGQPSTPNLADKTDPSSVPQNLSMRDTQMHSILPRTRFRTSFDPDQEIPRLQHWFSQNQHPTREQMMQYLNELNALESRRGRKPLDLTNIIYWFKNQRALQRRKVGSGDEDQSNMLNHSMELGNEEQDESMDERLSANSPDHVPILPNSNAVYMVTPLHANDGDEATGVVTITEEEMEKFDGDGSHVQQVVNNNNNNDLDAERKETKNPTDEEDDNEDVKDLSMNKSGSGCSLVAEHRPVNGDYVNGGSPERRHNGSIESDVPKLNMVYKREREDDHMYDSGHSNSSSPIPSPTRMSSASALQAGYQFHHLQQPLGIATSIQQALNMPPYLHPAHAFYAAGIDGSQLMGHSPHHHHLSNSSEDRKKRSRVFIDPLTEIPKLEKWFMEDTHPSSYMIEKYTEDLNRSEYRQRFPRLEPKNVQLWFKNHRAKVKRARLEHNVSNVLEHNVSNVLEHSVSNVSC
jgi:homeobox domain-containing protein